MELIPVAHGVSWLDIPEAELYILCGSPADVMKHLKQKGFITSKAKKGTYYETGPNAVLLSDVPVQNGQFCNLVEFPLLHMLYFQGMGIPDHVNNSGEKPLLIGSNTQVKAQLESIFRGRYGLASLEELMDAGLPEDLAKEFFRIKNYYAYNSIKKPEETIETCILKNDDEEIRNGVRIIRRDINIFQISYGKDEITVDLNMPKG